MSSTAGGVGLVRLWQVQRLGALASGLVLDLRSYDAYASEGSERAGDQEVVEV